VFLVRASSVRLDSQSFLTPYGFHRISGLKRASAGQDNNHHQLEGLYFKSPHHEDPRVPLKNSLVDGELVLDVDPQTKKAKNPQSSLPECALTLKAHSDRKTRGIHVSTAWWGLKWASTGSVKIYPTIPNKPGFHQQTPDFSSSVCVTSTKIYATGWRRSYVPPSLPSRTPPV
jgi:hypothetical protein